MPDLLGSNRANIDGRSRSVVASRDAKAKGFVDATSSWAYGDPPTLPLSLRRRLARYDSPLGLPSCSGTLTDYTGDVNYRQESKRVAALAVPRLAQEMSTIPSLSRALQSLFN